MDLNVVEIDKIKCLEEFFGDKLIRLLSICGECIF